MTSSSPSSSSSIFQVKNVPLFLGLAVVSYTVAAVVYRAVTEWRYPAPPVSPVGASSPTTVPASGLSAPSSPATLLTAQIAQSDSTTSGAASSHGASAEHIGSARGSRTSPRQLASSIAASSAAAWSTLALRPLPVGAADPHLLAAAKALVLGSGAWSFAPVSWADAAAGLGVHLSFKSAVPRGVERDAGACSVSVSFVPVATSEYQTLQHQKYLQQFDFVARFFAPREHGGAAAAASPSDLLEHFIRDELTGLERDGYSALPLSAAAAAIGGATTASAASAGASSSALAASLAAQESVAASKSIVSHASRFCEQVQLYLPKPLVVSSAALVASRAARAPSAWEHVFVLQAMQPGTRDAAGVSGAEKRRSVIFIPTPAACGAATSSVRMHAIRVHHSEPIRWSRPPAVVSGTVLPSFFRFDAPLPSSTTVLSEPRGSVGLKLTACLLLPHPQLLPPRVEIYGADMNEDRVAGQQLPFSSSSSSSPSGTNRQHHHHAPRAPSGGPLSPEPHLPSSSSLSSSTAQQPLVVPVSSISPAASALRVPQRIRVIKSKERSGDRIDAVASSSQQPSPQRSVSRTLSTSSGNAGAAAAAAVVVLPSRGRGDDDILSMHVPVAAGAFLASDRKQRVTFVAGYDFSFADVDAKASADTVAKRASQRILQSVPVADADVEVQCVGPDEAVQRSTGSASSLSAPQLHLSFFDNHRIELRDAPPLVVSGWRGVCSTVSSTASSPASPAPFSAQHQATQQQQPLLRQQHVVGICLFALPRDSLLRHGVSVTALDLLREEWNLHQQRHHHRQYTKSRSASQDTHDDHDGNRAPAPSHAWFCVALLASGAAPHRLQQQYQFEHSIRLDLFEPLWHNFSIGRVAALSNSVSRGGIEYCLAAMPSVRCVLQRFAAPTVAASGNPNLNPCFGVWEPPNGSPTAVFYQQQQQQHHQQQSLPLSFIFMRLRQAVSVRELDPKMLFWHNSDVHQHVAPVSSLYRRMWLRFHVAVLSNLFPECCDATFSSSAPASSWYPLCVEHIASLPLGESENSQAEESGECDTDQNMNSVVALVDESRYQHHLHSQNNNVSSAVFSPVMTQHISAQLPSVVCPLPLCPVKDACRFVAFVLLPPVASVPSVARQTGPQIVHRQLEAQQQSGSGMVQQSSSSNFSADVDCSQRVCLEIHSAPFLMPPPHAAGKDAVAERRREFMFFLTKHLKCV